MAVEFISGMLERDFISRCRPSVTVKVAFMLGSSKQGNARRASVGSIWETAKNLSDKTSEMRVTMPISTRVRKENLSLNSLFHAVLLIAGTIETFEGVGQVGHKIH